jgi:hypothetical protein
MLEWSGPGMGSFDCVAIPLREIATALRMTETYWAPPAIDGTSSTSSPSLNA